MMSDYMTNWELQIEIYKRDKQRKFRLYKIRRLLGLNIDVGIKSFVLWHKQGWTSYDTKEYNERTFEYK